MKKDALEARRTRYVDRSKDGKFITQPRIAKPYGYFRDDWPEDMVPKYDEENDIWVPLK